MTTKTHDPRVQVVNHGPENWRTEVQDEPGASWDITGPPYPTKAEALLHVDETAARCFDTPAGEMTAFLTHVRQVWEMRDAAGRRDVERGFDAMAGGLFNEVIWKDKHDCLEERFDRAVEHATAEAAGDRRTLARVRRFCADNRTRKTVSREDLAVLLSKCDICGIRDAAYLQHGRPVCEQDYAHLTAGGELAR